MISLRGRKKERNLLDLAFQVSLVVRNPPADAGDRRDMGSLPGLGRSPGGWHSNPLHYPCLENAVDRGDWWATVHRVTELDTTEVTECIHTHLLDSMN